MRSIFIALVIINLVVFAAQWFMRDPPSPSPSQVAHRPMPQGASLQLLSEIDNLTSKNVPLGPAPSPSAADVQASGMCTMVGPFVQLLHAEYLEERLRAMEVKAEIRSVEVPDGLGYWVYLPPEMSEKEALRRLYELQAKKIDSYIIPNGELTNGISLGIFSERSVADARLSEISAQGYQPEVREVARTLSETWVVMPVTEEEKIDAEIWVDLLQQQPGLEKRQNYCLGVAPN